MTRKYTWSDFLRRQTYNIYNTFSYSLTVIACTPAQRSTAKIVTNIERQERILSFALRGYGSKIKTRLQASSWLAFRRWEWDREWNEHCQIRQLIKNTVKMHHKNSTHIKCRKAPPRAQVSFNYLVEDSMGRMWLHSTEPVWRIEREGIDDFVDLRSWEEDICSDEIEFMNVTCSFKRF